MTHMQAAACSLPLLLAFTFPAFAADQGPLDQKVQISLGGFFLETEAVMRLDSDDGRIGTDVDFARDLGVSEQDRVRLDAFWRFADRHAIRAMFFENNRSASRTLDRRIEFGDAVYEINAGVEAQIDMQIIELAYEYAFLKRDNLELAGSFGIHDLLIEAAMRGGVAAPGNAAVVEEVGDVNGPLPVIGLRLFWHIGGKFYLDGLAQVFALEYGDYGGSLTDLKVGVTWYPWRHVGFGVAYNRFVGRLEVDDDDFDGKVRVEYAGPIASVIVGF